MSKLKFIQIALQGLDQARFQVLCDAYLRKQGFRQVHPVGLVIGADKVRQGTPDSFVRLDNGKFLFAEYSTQQKGVAAKFEEDIEKCLDSEKTGIPIDEIEAIVLCHNTMLRPDEVRRLDQLVSQHGVRLRIFSIGELSADLLEKYPDLAMEYLGTPIDTGQVLDEEGFIRMYQSSSYASPIDTPFLDRDTDLEKIVHEMESHDALLVTGRPGVGKTRLVRECVHRFLASHPEFQARYIFNRGPNLFDDLRTHFSESGNYLLVVDDANRFSGNLDYLFQLLQETTNDRRFKIACTVRDYARDMVRATASRYTVPQEVEIMGLDDDGIRKLMGIVFPELVPAAIERIVHLAEGNPRIAMMAASTAMQSGLMSSILDVSSLYDVYFGSIRSDVESVNEPDLWRVAAIITFFQRVDRSSAEQMKMLEDVFAIDPERFWDLARRLHELEVVDMYEGEIVRITDQVLATYLFYRAVFKDRLLEIEPFLTKLFPRYRHRLTDTIGPVHSAFDHHLVESLLKPVFSRVWDQFAADSNSDNLFELMEAFWWLDPTKVLRLMRDLVNALEPETFEHSGFDWKSSSNVPRLSLLSILSRMKFTSQYEAALQLLLQYAEKRPSHIPFVLHILTTDFGFEPDSYHDEYQRERAMLNSAWDAWVRSGTFQAGRQYLAVVDAMIDTHYRTISYRRRHTYTMHNFDLVPTEHLRELRQTMLGRLLELDLHTEYRPTVREILMKYPQRGYQNSSKEIGAWDMEILLPYIQSVLDPTNYADCLLVQGLVSHCKRLDISFPIEIAERFTNPTYELSEFLRNDRHELLDLGYEEYQRRRYEEIRDRFANSSSIEIEELIGQAGEILRGPDAANRAYHVRERLVDIFEVLADGNPTLFTNIFGAYLESGNPLQIPADRLVKQMLAKLGPDSTLEILERATGERKDDWRVAYYVFMPADCVTEKHVEAVYKLYECADWTVIPYRSDFFKNYMVLDSNFANRIVRTLVHRSSERADFLRPLSQLFNIFTPRDEQLDLLQSIDADLLKQTYLSILPIDDRRDHHGHGLNLILDRDPSFIRSCVRANCRKLGERSPHGEKDYTVLWERTDYAQVVYDALDELFICDSDSRLDVGSIPKRVLAFSADSVKQDPELHDKRLRLLESIISERYGDPEFMRFLFNVIADFNAETRKRLIDHFLRNSSDVELFRSLRLAPHHWSSEGGSMVPVATRFKEFYESLLPLLSGYALLDHRAFIEENIEWWRSRVENEKRNDFLRD